jgi:hypothetical protein
MDCKYTVVQSSGRVVECYRGKRAQPEGLDGASMRDPFLNLPQEGEVDNRLRINQPHSQAPPCKNLDNSYVLFFVDWSFCITQTLE